jgi:xanthine dehydrogenase YagR molybdenum-binding subunit
MTQSNHIGKPVNRVDGPAKVTGAAKYAAEFNMPGLAWGYVVSSTIAKGKITAIHSNEILAIPGVLAVYSHENIKGVAKLNMKYGDLDAASGSHFKPLHDAKVRFSMQPVALVLAETFEIARFAASLLRIDYEQKPHETDLRENRKNAEDPKKHRNPPAKPRGNPGQAFRDSAAQVKAEYFHEAEHHNPMEMYASTAVFDGDGQLTVYDKTQGVLNVQSYVSKVFGISKKKVRVLSPFMGGGFGSGLRPQYQVFMAVLGAKMLRRPVRVVLTREQMFSFGHRPSTGQLLALGADPDGKLQAMYHYAYSETSNFEEYTENVVNWSGMLYSCDNVKLGHKVVKLDLFTPLDMRAPGAATGLPALESAMDELAVALNMDPMELRLKNYAAEDGNMGKPYSSKALESCYEEGARKFGWDQRQAQPRSRKEGHKLIGLGMATGVWEAQHMPAAAKAVLTVDGRLAISAAVTDIGTGTYTIMTQIAAQILGLPMEAVSFKLGDSDLPFTLLQGGSWTAASTGTAVLDACQLVGRKLLRLAQALPESPFKKVKFRDVIFSAGAIRLRRNPAIALQITEIMRASNVDRIARKHLTVPNVLKLRKYARNTHSAVFVEVAVDEDLGTIEIRRMVNAVAGGRILNPKTARSQILGGMVWGISMALHEESVPDHHYGRFMNHSLAEYHVSVNADIPELDVIFVEEHDDIVSPIGVKGLGEIGIVGVPAAIANAIYNATGKRVREWPVTLDKLL